jgi:hypothetical protein
MWIAKGTFLGAWLFSFGTIAFLYLAVLRNRPPHSAVSVNILTSLTTQNAWWWIALVACLALGCAIVRSWPLTVPLALWITLLVTSVIPLGLLGLVFAIWQKFEALSH